MMSNSFPIVDTCKFVVRISGDQISSIRVVVVIVVVGWLTHCGLLVLCVILKLTHASVKFKSETFSL